MTELAAGLAIGLAAGISPGPLQALVVTATLRNGFPAGWRVAMAPLLSDGPIVATSLFAVGSMPDGWVRGLAMVGGAVVVAFGLGELQSLRRDEAPADDIDMGAGYVVKGFLVNALSPHPWIFWFAAGAPALIRAWQGAPWRGLAFLAGFYATLVGSKVALAAVVAAGRTRLTSHWRRRLIAAGGALLVVGGALLILQAR